MRRLASSASPLLMTSRSHCADERRASAIGIAAIVKSPASLSESSALTAAIAEPSTHAAPARPSLVVSVSSAVVESEECGESTAALAALAALVAPDEVEAATLATTLATTLARASSVCVEPVISASSSPQRRSSEPLALDWQRRSRAACPTPHERASCHTRGPGTIMLRCFWCQPTRESEADGGATRAEHASASSSEIALSWGDIASSCRMAASPPPSASCPLRGSGAAQKIVGRGAASIAQRQAAHWSASSAGSISGACEGASVSTIARGAACEAAARSRVRAAS